MTEPERVGGLPLDPYLGQLLSYWAHSDKQADVWAHCVDKKWSKSGSCVGTKWLVMCGRGYQRHLIRPCFRVLRVAGGSTVPCCAVRSIKLTVSPAL